MYDIHPALSLKSGSDTKERDFAKLVAIVPKGLPHLE
jgi:hypothetical protein